MERVEVTDLYQASFYFLSGCKLISVDCIPTGTTSSCQITLQGSKALLSNLARSWFDKEASVNLWHFRNAYSVINTCVQQAKKSYEFESRYGSAASGGDAR